MDILAIHRETGAFWNEIADTYGDEADSTAFLISGGNYLFEAEQQILGDLSPCCECAIHLQCSHGSDTLSLLRQGAANVVGVDMSERLLAIAHRKTQALSAAATWHCSDILQMPDSLNGTANLVYTGSVHADGRGVIPLLATGAIRQRRRGTGAADNEPHSSCSASECRNKGRFKQRGVISAIGTGEEIDLLYARAKTSTCLSRH